MGGLTLPLYLVRRIGMWFLTIWLGATIIFFVPRLAPGDPVAAMVSRLSAQSGFVEGSTQMIEAWRVRFGLDEPLYIQYFNYLRNLLSFDLGFSLASFPSRVNELIADALPWTLGLLITCHLDLFCGW